MDYMVMIVDDDPKSMKLTYDLLNVFGYATIQATTGRQAVELALSKKPNLIIMDIQLPEMNGIDAIKTIKADPTTRNIPIIAATANAMKGDEERVYEAGGDGYLTKPINIRELLNVVEKYAGERNRSNYLNRSVQNERR